MAPGAIGSLQGCPGGRAFRQHAVVVELMKAFEAFADLVRWRDGVSLKSVLGENARELPRRMNFEFSKRASELRADVHDEGERRLFDDLSEDLYSDLMAEVEFHVLGQKQAVDSRRILRFVEESFRRNVSHQPKCNFLVYCGEPCNCGSGRFLQDLWDLDSSLG